MKSIPTLVASLAIATLAGSCAADLQSFHAMPMLNTIIIANSGSTNTIGYRVLISSSGQATYASGDGTGQATLEDMLVDRLKRDIAAASPLASLSVLPCPKSASFGTPTFVMVGSDHSPDLNCRAAGAARALQVDVSEITALLGLRIVARGQGKELPPENK